MKPTQELLGSTLGVVYERLFIILFKRSVPALKKKAHWKKTGLFSVIAAPLPVHHLGRRKIEEPVGLCLYSPTSPNFCAFGLSDTGDARPSLLQHTLAARSCVIYANAARCAHFAQSLAHDLEVDGVVVREAQRPSLRAPPEKIENDFNF